jgi:CubicO group peptidase (beta-lactamase class C family)
LLSLVAVLTAGPALAQEGVIQQQGPTDPAELEAFLDELMAEQMEEFHIPGAAVSVVKDGALFFAKGYGFADLEKQIPVDPKRTIFRIGSGSKLFTATAVMQLVEQDKLDLDTDVNAYLDFQIPDTYPEPITLKHLLSHTAGFDVSALNIGVRSANDLLPTGEWLRTHMRARIRPPGQVPAYSNYGLTLAGYIVERVAGMPYEQYIEENILEPLGMEHTTARQPLPPELAPDYYAGYVYADGVYQSVYQLGLGDSEFENTTVPPAGSVSASATDMAKFMIAHLGDGYYSDENIAATRILEEATAQQMHGTLFAYDPRLNGLAYAFWELSWNDQWIIGHPGDMITHHSMLALLPDRNLGLYAVWNGEGGLQLNEGPFLQAFLDHYYPVAELDPVPLADAAERAGRYIGSYRMNVGSITTWEKMMAIFGALNLRDSGDGTLLLDTPYGQQRWVEVEPLVFHEVGGQDMVIFEDDDQGRIIRAFVHSQPRMTIEKLAWHESPGLHMPLLLGSVLVFLTMVIAAPVSAIRARRRGSETEPQPRLARVARWLAVGASALLVLFTAGLFILMGTMTWYTPMFGTPPFLTALLVLPVLAAVLTVGALVFTVLAWKDRYWGVAGRVHYTVVTITAVVFLWSLNTLNLLGWRF